MSLVYLSGTLIQLLAKATAKIMKGESTLRITIYGNGVLMGFFPSLSSAVCQYLHGYMHNTRNVGEMLQNLIDIRSFHGPHCLNERGHVVTKLSVRASSSSCGWMTRLIIHQKCDFGSHIQTLATHRHAETQRIEYC